MGPGLTYQPLEWQAAEGPDGFGIGDDRQEDPVQSGLRVLLDPAQDGATVVRVIVEHQADADRCHDRHSSHCRKIGKYIRKIEWQRAAERIICTCGKMRREHSTP